MDVLLTVVTSGVDISCVDLIFYFCAWSYFCSCLRTLNFDLVVFKISMNANFKTLGGDGVILLTSL